MRLAKLGKAVNNPVTSCSLAVSGWPQGWDKTHDMAMQSLKLHLIQLAWLSSLGIARQVIMVIRITAYCRPGAVTRYNAALTLGICAACLAGAVVIHQLLSAT